MSKHFGFLVVSRRTGYMLEGKDRAAKIFGSEKDAKSKCQIINQQVPVHISYEHVTQSLLKGSAFSFESEEVYQKFMYSLRHDAAHKPFLQFSQDRTFVRWRSTGDAKAAPGAGVAAVNAVGAVPAKVA
jgi:hypothetical protein